MSDENVARTITILVTISGLLGVFITLAPPQTKRWKWACGIGFVVLGLAGYWFSSDQVDRNKIAKDRDKRESDQETSRLNAKIDELKMDNAKSSAFLSGQLTILQSSAATSSSKDLRGIAEAIKGTIFSEPKSFTNSQLKEATQDLARRLREFQIQISAESNRSWEADRKKSIDAQRNGDKTVIERSFAERSAETMNLAARQRASFGPLRAEAEVLKMQLLNRLPAQPTNRFVDPILSDGMLVGPHPAAAVADYLEQLAFKLSIK